ncbi:molybdopterin molybdotransferase MoeA [Pararhizobium haloflavum]|uniref:molybdopterin molybdotransferase MoeA n=1 Tax=Pararhizobium haloflavum TaxID=2037914 RepID=UPI000C1A0827|nr:gephyrin-like molybdotransferase Glp [Pararhizobium haloflavum]
MSLLPVAEALERLLANAAQIETVEMVPLRAACGRVLARDLVGQRDQPPFPASAMDGYAVRAADVAPGRTLQVMGEAAAGHRFSGRIGEGQTVRIFTGAPVPDGADAILIQENAEVVSSDRIVARESVDQGRSVRPTGLDFRAGETLLAAGCALDPGRVTLAAAANLAELPVIRKPRIAVLATGDELVAPSGMPAPDQIIASNSYGVMAIAEACGAEAIDLGIVADQRDALDGAIAQAESQAVDVLVTLGGASVGDHDLVQAALAARGMNLAFWKIAMRPGKPLMSGRLGPIHVLGLPGNPVSSLVCSHLFLKPLIARLGGQAHRDDIQSARLVMDVPANDHRQDYLRARLVRGDDGVLFAEAAPRQDSSMMRVFAEADGLIVRPPNAPAARSGDMCEVLRLRPI